MPIKLKANNGNIDLKVPIQQVGGKVDSVNGMTGDVVLDIPSKTSDLVNDSGFITQIPDEYITETELDAKGYLTEHQSLAEYAKKSEIPDVSGYVTDTELNTAISSAEERVDFKLGSYALKTEVPSVEGLASTQYVDEKVAAIVVPSLDGYATEQWVEGKGYLTQHQSLADYATKSELDAKQDTLTAGTNITIENGVISATGGSSGSSIKSIRFRTGKIDEEETASQFKEWLTYLWDIGNGSYVDLSKCIVTIDGQVINSVYCQNMGTSQYIYFYPAILSNFDNSDKLARYFYVCDYLTAMTKTQAYSYISKSQYATTLLTSDNYTQYISISGNYTTDVSDGNLSIASELYVGISTSDGRKSSVNIKLPQNYVLNEKTNEYFYFPESESSNGYLYYDGNSLNVSGLNTIEYIWYK